MEEEKLLILYATETGNALDAAERLAREAETRGCPVHILSLDEFDPSSLPRENFVIFVVSTTGQGDTPNPMKAFWTFILQRSLGRHWLENTRYAIFGLGDSAYQKYNFVAKKLDKRLTDLGGTSIIEKGLGDDQHPSGYEGALDPWMSSLWTILYTQNPLLFPKGINISGSDIKTLHPPKLDITYLDSHQVYSQTEGQIDLKSFEKEIIMSRSMLSGKKSNDKNKPDCFLKMVKNHPLCRPGCGKDVRHFEFEAVSSTINYEVGDVIDILPGQNPEAIDAFIKRCYLNPKSYIIVKHKNKDDFREDGVINVPINLKRFIELTMDIASASPRRYFFEVMSFFASAQHEKERLEYFSSPEGRDDLYQYNQKERRTVLEVLEDFPSVNMPFEWLVQLVPPLKTRAFSISSSMLVHPNQVHLTVSIVSWTTPFKRKRNGLCSSWLASLDHNQCVCIPAWFHKGCLPAPDPSLPLILIGPGTGCAPFHGFVEERALMDNKGVPTSPILFFFGCRNEQNDFLYKDFWALHSQNSNVLSEQKGGGFCVAFSRDQPKKVYVQHKMREQKAKVWELLSNGAAVYVAGSSNNMPADVLAAFEDVVAEEGGVGRDDAVRWLRMLEKGGKYHVEAWA
ncbi:NADPH-dependent diflavin oxidoreductase 1-like [Bidens hawaiensis]|uniref:NADPH-dependent diflavin oxidoreductase 1-like n=1 Tax=Bidens hawaiensis TaxID=980011 RepID=UPI00404A9B81